MKKSSILFLFLCITISFKGLSQKNKQIQSINNQVWDNFTKAFETHDHVLFSNIHSMDLIRISGNNDNIKHYADYMAGYEKRWRNATREQTISFRFIERIADETNGSERGIYRLTINPNTDEAEHHYGEFHVILVKENGIWKILIDYDSDENNTVDATSYNKGFAIDDFDRY